MVVCFGFGNSKFIKRESACVLEGCHGGLVGTKALGGRMGHVCCMGMNFGFGFYVLFCKPVDVVEGNSLRACCFDGGVCNVGVGGG